MLLLVAGDIIRIGSFVPSLKVIESKQRPRKLAIIGSDGKEYTFLLKGALPFCCFPCLSVFTDPVDVLLTPPRLPMLSWRPLCPEISLAVATFSSHRGPC